MQIQISNESDAIHVATTAGFGSVEEYVNRMIKQAADLEATREGLADVEAGRMRPFAEFDSEFRKQMGFADRTTD